MNQIKKPKLKFGRILAACRREKGLSLADVSKKLQIPFKYLEAMEYNDFRSLPEESKWKKILQKYADHLALDFKEIYHIARNDLKRTVGLQHSVEKNYLRSWPKAIRFLVIVIVLIGIVVFLGFRVNQIFSAPQLDILEPLDGSKTYEKQIKVIGISRKEAEISINNNPIFVDSAGRFETVVDLQNGLNLIKITAKKKYSRIKEVDLRILSSEQGS